MWKATLASACPSSAKTTIKENASLSTLPDPFQFLRLNRQALRQKATSTPTIRVTTTADTQ